ncbi:MULTISPECIES: GNAT family protein [unclassified Streptomyces]|uniref:GNAT family N-acetyltransferase n=1 Tax=unclassified Streptomyces TaxID=2593676 RepID=UPI000A8EA7FF|nr:MULTISPECIES: GNAT family protein [unclassified Streptomyces]
MGAGPGRRLLHRRGLRRAARRAPRRTGRGRLPLPRSARRRRPHRARPLQPHGRRHGRGRRTGLPARARATGRGLATAAVRELRALAGASLGLSRVWADTDVHNTASRAVLARAGFGPGVPVDREGKPALRHVRVL